MKRYWHIFSYFFLLGLTTFGGGLAMIPAMKNHSLTKQWVSASQWEDLMTIAQLTPGAIAINLAHLIGRTIAGWIGGVIAMIAMILPSMMVILVLVSGFAYVLNLPAMISILKGVLIVATIFIIQAWLAMAKPIYIKPLLLSLSLFVVSILIFEIVSPVIVMVGLFVVTTILVLLFPKARIKP